MWGRAAVAITLEGVAVLFVGIWLGTLNTENSGVSILFGLLVAGAVLWLFVTGAFALIKEQPGATEGGGNALSVALKQLGLISLAATFFIRKLPEVSAATYSQAVMTIIFF